MKTAFLSHFTPSLMTPEALEAIFVQREDLVKRLVELVRESTLTPSKHHALLIGPRGIGKTHLIALIYHRVLAMEDLRDRLLIAWLREEEWGVTSFLDLLLRIFRALPEKSDDIEKRIESLYDLPPDAAERAGANLLKEIAGGRTLLILVENMDDLFNGLGDEGQKRLRAYLQENPFCAILGSAQSLFCGVSLQTSPFYGFFRIHHLDGLEIEEATRLLTNIAHLQGDNELASFIQTPTGRARIRAVHHLAGGNHRVYVIFSHFLTRESLDELVEPFLRTLDELTPYYQARMAWLSPQQRKIVEFLIDRRGAVPVKEIAQRCFISHQTATGQLKILREMGYVYAESVGRESYYELQEPLMRMCVEVKKQRGGLIRLIVEFLRIWYSQMELLQRLGELQSKGSEVKLEREYILAALAEYEVVKTKEVLEENLDLDVLVREWLQAPDTEKESRWKPIDTAARKLIQKIGRIYQVDANDLAQDVFYRFLTWANREDAKKSDVKNYAAYIYKMARNRAVDILKDKNKNISLEANLDVLEKQSDPVTRYLDGIESLDFFKRLKQEEFLAQVDYYVRYYLIEASGDLQVLKKRMEEVLVSLIQYGAEDLLVKNLIGCLPLLYRRSHFRNWCRAAQEILGGYEEFQLPLRLLDAAVRYRETHDRRILLKLPVEERKVLEELLEEGRAKTEDR